MEIYIEDFYSKIEDIISDFNIYKKITVKIFKILIVRNNSNIYANQEIWNNIF